MPKIRKFSELSKLQQNIITLFLDALETAVDAGITPAEIYALVEDFDKYK